MADHGEVALRMLDPRWARLVGTVRIWTHHGRLRAYMEAEQGRATPGVGSVSVILRADVGSEGFGGPPDETEAWSQFWLDSAGRVRCEHLVGPSGPSFMTTLDDGRVSIVDRPDGRVYRTERRPGDGVGGPEPWVGDGGRYLSFVTVRITEDVDFLGRPAVRAVAVPRLSNSQALARFGPMATGTMTGAEGRMVIDGETGVVLRYEALDADGLAMSVHEFTAIEVDGPIPDERFTFQLAPGQRFRTLEDDRLDLLRSQGVDVSHIDAGDPEAVSDAMRRFHEERGGGRPQFVEPEPPRLPLRERVVASGPPPPDEDDARAAIARAVAGLSPADPEPRREWIERGELLDDPFARSRENTAGATRGMTVVIELADVAFVSTDEAVIEFTISFGAGRILRPGRAVHRRGRWVVSYDTAAGLLQLGGVWVPPLEDLPPDDEALT